MPRTGVHAPSSCSSFLILGQGRHTGEGGGKTALHLPATKSSPWQHSACSLCLSPSQRLPRNVEHPGCLLLCPILPPEGRRPFSERGQLALSGPAWLWLLKDGDSPQCPQALPWEGGRSEKPPRNLFPGSGWAGLAQDPSAGRGGGSLRVAACAGVRCEDCRVWWAHCPLGPALFSPLLGPRRSGTGSGRMKPALPGAGILG